MSYFRIGFKNLPYSTRIQDLMTLFMHFNSESMNLSINSIVLFRVSKDLLHIVAEGFRLSQILKHFLTLLNLRRLKRLDSIFDILETDRLRNNL